MFCYTKAMSGGGGHTGFRLPLMGLAEKLADSHSGLSIDGKAIMYAFPIVLLGFLVLDPGQTMRNFAFLIFFAPLWMPSILVYYAFMRFHQYRRWVFHSKQQYVLLELRMPRDTRKSPAAMEAIFSNLHLAPGEGTWWKKYILGGSRPWFSFEIASLGGRVHFYVWTRESMRRAVETYFYAQYPGVEVVEAIDYSRIIDPNSPPYRTFACEFGQSKPDPYPIKSYIDFGLGDNPKPEESVDPVAQVIEFMGSLGPQEQLWLQFVIRVTKGEKFKGRKNAKGKQYTWKDEGREEVERIREEATVQTEYKDKMTGEMKQASGFPNPTKGQQEMIAAIERNIGKLGFDVGIRAVYTAPADKYYPTIGALVTSIFKPFNSESYNSLGSVPHFSEAFKDYPWEDPKGVKLRKSLHEAVTVYRMRSFYHPPYEGAFMTMSTEELASLYHVPSSAITTPSLPRIQSATGEAPADLPI